MKKPEVRSNCMWDVCNSMMITEFQTRPSHAFFDLCTSGNLLPPNAPVINQKPTTISLHITFSDGQTIKSTAQSFLLWDRSHCRQESCTFISHFHQKLLHFCIQSRRWCHILLYLLQQSIILQGPRDKSTKLWTLQLQTNATPNSRTDDETLKFQLKQKSNVTPLPTLLTCQHNKT